MNQMTICLIIFILTLLALSLIHIFDVPVPALDEEFDLALIGTKGVWYDHKVSVSNPELLQD